MLYHNDQTPKLHYDHKQTFKSYAWDYVLRVTENEKWTSGDNARVSILGYIPRPGDVQRGEVQRRQQLHLRARPLLQPGQPQPGKELLHRHPRRVQGHRVRRDDALPGHP